MALTGDREAVGYDSTRTGHGCGTRLSNARPPWSSAQITMRAATRTAQRGGPVTISRRFQLISMSIEGLNTITYSAFDNAGNAESPHTLQVQLDKTPPAFSGLPAAHCGRRTNNL
jgi:hypothetical protein